MTEQAPYRLERQSANHKFIRLASEVLAVWFVVVNWAATQWTAAVLRYAPFLSGRLIGHLYQPFGWYWWQHRWADNAVRIGNRIILLGPMWRSCERLVIYSILVVGLLMAVCALFVMSPRQAADLHGSASWASESEIREANLL
jgi:type IV secretory pathway TraG/TraD family ATPase VirD4